MLKTSIHSCLTLALMSSSACFAAITPQAGLWESTSEIPAEQKAMFQAMPPEALQQMQKSGMKVDAKAGTMTSTFCINKDQMTDWHQMGQKPLQDCEKPQISDSGNVVKMNMVCKKPHASKMQSTITFNTARDAYQFEHHIQSDQHAMKMRGSAKRIGNCK